jgi:tRNA-specific 2-thiouridylase
MRIVVGLSGGVDSAVTAFLCKQQGHDVSGVFMKIWKDDEKSNINHPAGNACYGPEELNDLEDAFEVCKKLDISLHVIDCSDAFQREILSYFKNTYLQGRTPNPCVFCNQQLKFGLLPSILQQQNHQFDYFATGHYARIEKDSGGTHHLKKALDLSKDQSYFLYRLTRQQIEHSLFPLGNLTKNQVRKIAFDAGLHLWDKEESQDFYSGDYRDLIKQNRAESDIGDIVNKNGEVLGKHDGIWKFTIGQRKGLGISSTKPLYITDILADENKLIVGEVDDLQKQCMYITDFQQLEAIPENAACKIRSASLLHECTVHRASNNSYRIEFDHPVNGVSPGQSAVLYDFDTVIGGGIIV